MWVFFQCLGPLYLVGERIVCLVYFKEGTVHLKCFIFASISVSSIPVGQTGWRCGDITWHHFHCRNAATHAQDSLSLPLTVSLYPSLSQHLITQAKLNTNVEREALVFNVCVPESWSECVWTTDNMACYQLAVNVHQ